jgi:hypothetical protein
MGLTEIPGGIYGAGESRQVVEIFAHPMQHFAARRDLTDEGERLK